MIIGVGMILAGLYAIIASRGISARARKEKWALGGNRVFVNIAGTLNLLTGVFLLWSSIEARQRAD